MTRRDLDVLLIVACSLVLAAIILAVPFAKAARIVLGLPFVLVFPGYTLAAALFPRKDHLDAIERVALGLSIAVVPLIGLALGHPPQPHPRHRNPVHRARRWRRPDPKADAPGG